MDISGILQSLFLISSFYRNLNPSYAATHEHWTVNEPSVSPNDGVFTLTVKLGDLVNSHLSVMLWHWWPLFLWVWGLSPTLRSGSREWSCSLSPAAGRWPAQWLTRDQTVWEQSGHCCHRGCTSCHHRNTSCSGGCRWCLLDLLCLWVATTPGWRRFRSPWIWGFLEQMEDLREDRGIDLFL